MGPLERSPAEAGDTHERSAQSDRSSNTGNLPQPAAELEVEQPAISKMEDVGSPADGSGVSTAAMKGDHVAGQKVECRPGDTWAERPQLAQTEASSSSPHQSKHNTHPPA
jgi:hypothetical protein